MSEYKSVKGGKLKLKGASDHKSSSKKHKKKRKREHEDGQAMEEKGKDAEKHGGWWAVTEFRNIKGNVAIEMGPKTFLFAMDNGLLTLGAPHKTTVEGPAPPEQITAIPVSDSKVAFKTGYGKFLGVDDKKRVVGRSDAMGPREMFEPIFQDGNLAMLAYNNCFVSCNDEGELMATSNKAGPDEMIVIRSDAPLIKKKKDDLPEEQKGDLRECEVSYVKKFQSFQDHRLIVNESARTGLSSAREKGKLHEALLDRREKMKADRYCK
ncbi:protein FRG1-like [Lytechinus pictus]|uniref:protein FRG1-like n=1 Tax=Lytechinus pictus TaxID=7653 RepID=UPI0030B9C0D5